MEEKSLLGIVIALLAIVLVCTFFMFGSIANNKDAINEKEVKVNVDLTAQNLKIDILTKTVDDLVEDLAFEENDTTGDYVLNKREYEGELSDDKALELAEESIDSKAFKKAVFDALEDFGVDIDSYKDITKIKVMDSDVNVRRDTGRVDLDVKVYYFLDGDEDENERARLDEFTITVDDLDVDEDFDDAEVDKSYLSSLCIEKVYD